MSTIETQNFKDLATSKSIDAAYVTDGTAKAWFYSSGTYSLTNSLNGNNITDNGTGNFNFSVTSAFSDINYMATATEVSNGAGGGAVIGLSSRTTVSQFLYYVRDAAAGTLEDNVFATGILMGDLA